MLGRRGNRLFGLKDLMIFSAGSVGRAPAAFQLTFTARPDTPGAPPESCSYHARE
jgi:hypothetical protein